MKASLKGINPKAFLIEHCEKIVLGLFGVVTLLLFWWSLGIEIYRVPPSDLEADAVRLLQKVNASTIEDYKTLNAQKIDTGAAQEKSIPQAATQLSNAGGASGTTSTPAGEEVVLLQPRKSWVNWPIAETPIRMKTPRDWGTLPGGFRDAPERPKTLPGQPEIYPIEEPHSTQGQGAIAMAAPEAGAAGLGDPTAGDGQTEPGVIDLGRNKKETKRPDRSGRNRRGRLQGEVDEQQLLQESLEILRAGRAFNRRLRGEEIEGPTGPGGFAGFGEGGASLSEGRQWICLTGRIPVQKELDEFKDALHNNRPSLYYELFEVQRQVLSAPGANPKPDAWQPVSLDDFVNESLQWATRAPALLPEELLGRTCLPLPPRVDQDWTADEVVHPSFKEYVLDLESQQNQLDGQIEEIEKELETADEKKDAKKLEVRNPLDELFFGRNNEYSSGGNYSDDSWRGGPPAPDGRGGYPRSGGQGYPYAGETRSGYPGEGGYGPGGREAAPYRMFRFFDFTAEPGKTYAYRVRLLVRNPNYKVPEEKLAPETNNTDLVLPSDWTVFPDKTLSEGQTLLAGPSKKGSSARDGELEIMMGSFSRDVGTRVYHKFELQRGDLANFPQTEVQVAPPGGGPREDKSIDFQSDLLVVDFTGSRRMLVERTDQAEPTEVVLVGPQGELVVRSQIVDEAEYLIGENLIKPPVIEQPDEYNPLLQEGYDPLLSPDGRQPGGRNRRNRQPGRFNRGG